MMAPVGSATTPRKFPVDILSEKSRDEKERQNKYSRDPKPMMSHRQFPFPSECCVLVIKTEQECKKLQQ